MLSIGFPKTRYREEFRIAMLPEQVREISHPELLFFQKGYGERLDIPDAEYERAGARITNSRGAYGKEILCQPKFCDEDLPFIHQGHIVFGWIHMIHGYRMQRQLSRKKATVIAWENMYKGKKHVFARNNQLTGQTGVLQAMAYVPKVPEECSAAVIGKGNVGKGAKAELETIGVKTIKVYDRKNVNELISNVGDYDIIVHCAAERYYDILTENDLKSMKSGAVLVHLGSDCVKHPVAPQSIYSPVNPINGGRNLVYAINHVPTLKYQTASRLISEDVAPYIDLLVQGNVNGTLGNAVVMCEGKVLEDRL